MYLRKRKWRRNISFKNMVPQYFQFNSFGIMFPWHIHCHSLPPWHTLHTSELAQWKTCQLIIVWLVSAWFSELIHHTIMYQAIWGQRRGQPRPRSSVTTPKLYAKGMYKLWLECALNLVKGWSYTKRIRPIPGFLTLNT